MIGERCWEAMRVWFYRLVVLDHCLWISEDCAWYCYVLYLSRDKSAKGGGRRFVNRVMHARQVSWFPTTLICLVGGWFCRPLWWCLIVLAVVSFIIGFITELRGILKSVI